ncbi:hypothetical protein, partial [Kineococcus sp. G2]|uniref:hypothetical protein n=1 Tax=Kineococcus sp. G2 TaxID=3127484 RepID=UPI00301CAFE4
EEHAEVLRSAEELHVQRVRVPGERVRIREQIVSVRVQPTEAVRAGVRQVAGEQAVRAELRTEHVEIDTAHPPETHTPLTTPHVPPGGIA